MSLAMIFEQRVNPTQNGITTPSMFAIHELSHWFGFPERYEPILNGNLDRTPATGFSPMGYSSLDSGRAHHIGYDRFRQGFMDQGTPALTVPKNTQPVVTTVDLVPIDLAPPLNGPLQSSLILVPTEQSADGFVGYTVESRVTGPTFGDIVYENGAIVSFVDTRNRADIFIMDDPNDNQPSVGNTRLAYEANDVFQDATRGVRIEVKAPVIPGTGATQILVTNTTPSQMKPDLEIRQWDERFWATPDIWIDRPPFLNPPDRADDLQGPDPYGNRDTPGVATNPTIENRIYFKVRNGGAATAFNAVVKAYFSMPGIGQGLSDWQPVNPGDQGVSFSQINPGQEVTGYLHWTVPAGTMPDGHACVKVVIQPLATGELSLENNIAQENIFRFETNKNSPWHSRSRQILVRNPSATEVVRVAMDTSALPTGWAAKLLPSTFSLAPGSSQLVDYAIYPAGPPGKPASDAPPGFVSKTNITAYGFFSTGGVRVLGGVQSQLALINLTTTSLTLVSKTATSMTVKGCVSGVGGTPIAARIVAFQAAYQTNHAWASGTTNSSGCVQLQIYGLLSGKTYQVVAHHSGTGMYGSSKSGVTSVVLP